LKKSPLKDPNNAYLKKVSSGLKDYDDGPRAVGKSLSVLEPHKSLHELSVSGTKIPDHEMSFVKNRKQMKPFYKNRKLKVITKEGSLIKNSSRDLIERSGTAGRSHRLEFPSGQNGGDDSLCMAVDGSPLVNRPLMVMDGSLDPSTLPEAPSNT